MRKIGIGYEFYKKMIEDDCYYVDKTMLIREVVKNGGDVTLFTRPRRFGKTLALTTIKAFFEKEYDNQGNVIDNRRFFEGKKIMQAEKNVVSKLGQYPVLFLTMKSAKTDTFESAFYQLKTAIVAEIARHCYLLGSDRLTDNEKKLIKNWIGSVDEPYSQDPKDHTRMEKDLSLFAGSFGELSRMLKKHHGKGTVILVDEYDVPLEAAFFNGFYKKMADFVRLFFESALKTNSGLEFAVITGCLRISKESIFTGLNNLTVVSVLSDGFGEFFGFTPEETGKMLSDYGFESKAEEVRRWYDGYLFGKSEVYNPWSVTNYIYEHLANPERLPRPYWSNTSSNSIVRDLIDGAGADVKDELETLVRGGTIEKKIHEDITYSDILKDENGNKKEDNLWNFLFFTGYLNKVSEKIDKEDIYLTLCIPNAEIRYVYRNQINDWFDNEVVKKADRSVLYKAVTGKDCDGIEEFMNGIMEQAISTFDSDESFYHGLFMSFLYGLPHYQVKSNREEGIGRPDITLLPERPRDIAIIFEVKTRKKFSEMEDGLAEAFEQIRTQRYEEGIIADGYAGVISFGICFCKKSCMVAQLPEK